MKLTKCVTIEYSYNEILVILRPYNDLVICKDGPDYLPITVLPLGTSSLVSLVIATDLSIDSHNFRRKDKTAKQAASVSEILHNS